MGLPKTFKLQHTIHLSFNYLTSLYGQRRWWHVGISQQEHTHEGDVWIQPPVGEALLVCL